MVSLQAITLFYSYSHEDEGLRNELDKHLSILRRSGLICDWHDRTITAGEDWDRQIDLHLNSADVILLLISADFLASEYCWSIEMETALRRHRSAEAVVIPIILRPVHWRGAPFSALQALPTDGRPITEWPNSDLAFQNVCEGILAAVLAWKNPSVASVSRLNREAPHRGSLWHSLQRMRARKRLLDAALPKQVPVGKATTLLALVRRKTSSGLAGLLDLDSTYAMEKGDIKSRSFPLVFPADDRGNPRPLPVLLKVDSPDFEPSSQTKHLTIPAYGDSELCVFLLKPLLVGQLLLNLEVYDRRVSTKSPTVSCLLRTTAGQFDDDVIYRPDVLVSIPLTVSTKKYGLDRCDQGHYFDTAIYSTCPHCSAGSLVRPVSRDDGAVLTSPCEASANNSSEPGVTVGVVSAEIGIDPVVGWLVCVEGPDKGMDYRIRAERNSIGRSVSMRIFIDGDPKISLENHAFVCFDPKTNVFTLDPGLGSRAVYLDGKVVSTSQSLRPYSKIQLGDTVLVFVPFCGENFTWP